jgi:hypothetical protein
MRSFTWILIMAISLGLLPHPGMGAEPKPGTIEGSLSYPSEFIPPDMTICAENLSTHKRYCTNKHIKGAKYTYKVGYKLALPPGDYHVFAFLPDPARYGAGYPKDYRAYYSEFVKCGQRADCVSHEPVPVKVRSGESLKGIDPQDWYR